MKPGKVFLVGAGPGDAELLTIKAAKTIGLADVVLVDDLVSEEVLQYASASARIVHVGKRGGCQSTPQQFIERLMVVEATQGRIVVRLKGGDPFVFGRGGEEAEALQAEGIAYEVVPGVTAALACAAQARIPLTHREAARSVTFLTGHTKDGRLDVDFEPLVRLGGTIAVYMGIVSLPQLRDGLFANGLARSTPAVLIERGGTVRQRELRGPLDDLVAQCAKWSTNGPTLVLIGAAVGRGIAYAAPTLPAHP